MSESIENKVKEKKPKKKLTKKRLALRIVLCTLGAILLIIGGYLIYVFASYHRIPDNQVLEVKPDLLTYAKMDRVPPQPIEVIPGGKTYTIMTYNIGFGAYTPDYSFFMDGGKSSWAKSEDALKENLVNIGQFIMDYHPDFTLLQEVDEYGTRTYHVNEINSMTGAYTYQFVYARNFDSPFLFWPLLEPHGANKSGLLTLSDARISSALRRSLPVADSVSKIVDYDRGYSISRIPLSGKYAGEKELILINVHLSAYSTEEVRQAQLAMLTEDLIKEYEAGNYIICGGDFNHDLRGVASENAPGWAQPFPTDALPEHFAFGFASPGSPEAEIHIGHNSCRDANQAFDPHTSFTVLADGFIVSDNIEVVYYESLNLGYAFSDHDPVMMEFRLLP